MSIEMDIKAEMGNEIAIDVANMSPYPDAPKVVTYKGIVLKSESWDPPKSFRLSGNIAFPTRVILYKNVVGIGGNVAEVPTDPDTIVRLVKVPSSNGKSDYMVTLDPINGNKCPCKGFHFRRTCSHIGQAIEIVEQEAQSVA